MNDSGIETIPSGRHSLPIWVARFFYNAVVLPLLYLAIRILSVFNGKIRRGIAGRRDLFEKLAQALEAGNSSGPVVLIHAASMGEYEQARPVFRALRKRYPGVVLVASVFSPSAYEHIREHHEADVVTYLPFDSPRRMRRFVQLIKPAVLLIVRYELWPNLIWEAERQGAYIALIDASVQSASFRRRWPARGFYRVLFRSIHRVLAISEEAAKQMQVFIADPRKLGVAGDTRFDQVVFRALEKKPQELIPESVLQRGPFWVAGSTWPEDDAVVVPAFARLKHRYALRLVLVPHEPSEAHVRQAEQRCQEHGLRAVRLSAYTPSIEWDVLIVDRVGILANLYAIGKMAFVGGSFGPGVHSVIEPAAHGLPVLFGPRMQNSPEAVAMVQEGCGFVVRTADDCAERLERWLDEPNQWQEAADRARQFVARRCGASEKIAGWVADLLESHKKNS